MSQKHSDRLKMAFDFERDGAHEVETLWVAPLPGGSYEVDNIPFYVRGIAAEDIVLGVDDGNGLRFASVAASGGHSTLRVIVFDSDKTSDVCNEFVRMGCEFEGSDTPGLIAIDIPPHVSWAGIQALLQRLADSGVLDWEEAAISRHHVP